MNEKNKIEALLFSSGKRMSLKEISELTGINQSDNIKSALTELKQDYENRGGSLCLEEEDGFWKLGVKDHYMTIAQKLVTKTELDKPLMETLAVIAWKYPLLQAEVVRIRHNKAYDHLKQLEEMGFISRNVYGRTRKITLTQKFFEYFDLPSKEQRKEAFKAMVPGETQEKIEGMEKDIDEGEKKISQYEQKKEEMRKQKEEELKKDKEKKLKKEDNNDQDKEDLEESQEKEDKEIDEMEKEEEELDEEMKDVGGFVNPLGEKDETGSEMSSVQAEDEVSKPDKGD
ncbi:hypothetical protein GF336_05720 [Candidatus Woesearchaeota archaeon]|nr:hypothetical protein [Candidatus Woesearchaeota archaeon]